jgi:hypothetical protein
VVVDVAMEADLAVEAQTIVVMYVHALLDLCIHLPRFEFNGWSGRVESVKLLLLCMVFSEVLPGRYRDECCCALAFIMQ